MRIDLGCGASCKPGFRGVDRLKLPGVEVVHDLDAFPYPFETGSVTEVWLDNVLEHLKEPMRAVEEIHRICAPEAKVTVAVPYFRSFYATIDPTHRNFFGVQWFNYFDPEHEFHKRYRYTNCALKVERIEFDREFTQVPSHHLLYHAMKSLANRKPVSYEVRLSHWYPLNSLTFHLRVKK